MQNMIVIYNLETQIKDSSDLFNTGPVTRG